MLMNFEYSMISVSFINICTTRQNIMHYMNSTEMIHKMMD